MITLTIPTRIEAGVEVEEEAVVEVVEIITTTKMATISTQEVTPEVTGEETITTVTITIEVEEATTTIATVEAILGTATVGIITAIIITGKIITIGVIMDLITQGVIAITTTRDGVQTLGVLTTTIIIAMALATKEEAIIADSETIIITLTKMAIKVGVEMETMASIITIMEVMGIVMETGTISKILLPDSRTTETTTFRTMEGLITIAMIITGTIEGEEVEEATEVINLEEGGGEEEATKEETSKIIFLETTGMTTITITTGMIITTIFRVPDQTPTTTKDTTTKDITTKITIITRVRDGEIVILGRMIILKMQVLINPMTLGVITPIMEGVLDKTIKKVRISIMGLIAVLEVLTKMNTMKRIQGIP